MDCADMNNNIFERQLKNLGYDVLCCKNDSELTIKYASGSFYGTLGYKEGEITALLNNRPNTVLRNEEPIDWCKIRSEIIKKGYAVPELRLIKKDGHHIWAQYRVCLVVKGGTEYFWGITEDITLKRRSHKVIREKARELKALSENIPGGVLRFHDDGPLTFAFISEGFCRITGYTKEEIACKFNGSLLNMVYGDDRSLLTESIKKQREKNKTIEITYRINAKSQHYIWVIDKLRRIMDCNGNVWLYSVLIDVTNTKKAQDDLAESEERYRLILEYASYPVLDFDLKNKKFYFSPVFYTKFGNHFSKKGDLFWYLENSDFVYSDDKRYVQESIIAAFNKEKTNDIDCRLKIASGKYIWCNVHHTVFFNSQGVPIRVIALISDIDKRKKETQILRIKAEHDLLTGLYNRVTTTNLIDRTLQNSPKGSSHAMFVIDIDNFKRVNDSFGHLCGDRLIVETAELLKKQFRADDIIGRIGGDEFVVFIKNIKSLDSIADKAQHICRLFNTLSNGPSRNCHISGSIGIAVYPGNGDNYYEIFQKADSAMYEAKKSGKDNYRIYKSCK